MQLLYLYLYIYIYIYILSDQICWCNVKLFLSYPKNYICKFMQVISWHHKLFHFQLPFWIWKVWKYLENEKIKIYKEVEYAIINTEQNSPFIIDVKNGSVQLISKLDYETKNIYEIIVKVKNKSSTSTNYLNDIKVFKVKVQDVNDENPTFTQQRYEVILLDSKFICHATAINWQCRWWEPYHPSLNGRTTRLTGSPLICYKKIESRRSKITSFTLGLVI